MEVVVVSVIMVMVLFGCKSSTTGGAGNDEEGITYVLAIVR